MGVKPEDMDLPPDITDFYIDVQNILQIYFNLTSTAIEGSYLGKDLSGINELLGIFEIENKQEALNIIWFIGRIESNYINKKIQAELKKAGTKNG